MEPREEDWLEGVAPAPPEPLRRRLTQERPPWPEGLGPAAEAALRDVLGEPAARDREVGFRLLDADALLTYACEAALEEDDPERRWTELLTRIGEMGPPS